jgi:sugar lactone lactonase YvrE
MRGAHVGIVVAGGTGWGSKRTQLNHPTGLWVDEIGTVYVAEAGNNQVTRWPKGEARGDVLVGGNDRGFASNQLAWPTGLSIDRQGNMNVADNNNHRVQRFKLEKN